MKTINCLLLFAFWANSTPLKAQRSHEYQSQHAGSQLLLVAQALPASGNLEDNPDFKRLTPQAQDWVREISQRVDKAIDQKDTRALAQISLDFAKHQLLGLTACGHKVDEGTFVDADPVSSSHEQAFAVRWLDPNPGDIVHTAIFTGSLRCVVMDGVVVDGRVIARALPNSLAVSNQHALTAWEGDYWNSSTEQLRGVPPHRGLFIENRFAFEIDRRNASVPNGPDLDDATRDFRWNDEKELIVPKPGIALPSASIPMSASGTWERRPIAASASAPVASANPSVASPAAAPRQPSATSVNNTPVLAKARPQARQQPVRQQSTSPKSAPKPAIKTPPAKPTRPKQPCVPLRPCPTAKQ